MLRQTVLFICLAATASWSSAAPGSSSPCPHPSAGSYYTIEVVFVLDTTGSMSAMIEDAKTTIWSIANEIAGLADGARLRFGIVFFRDRGDTFVTRRVALSEDLDAVYAQLLEMRADGGGDGPESVNQALADAIGGTRWAIGPGARRVIFLVGDAPPHDDYSDDTAWATSCETARSSGIPINTIRYGEHPDTRRIWNEIAARTQGAALRVARVTTAAERSTPFDFQLALHSRLLDSTAIPYGDPDRAEADEARRERTAVIERDGSEAALADRAAYRAGATRRATLAANDLVGDLIAGRVTLEELDEAILPEVLRELSPAERERYVANRIEQRRGILSEIDYYRKERTDHLDARRTGEHQDFDSAILRAVRCQIGGDSE